MRKAIALAVVLASALFGQALGPKFDKPAIEKYVRHLLLWSPGVVVTIGDPTPAALPGFYQFSVHGALGNNTQDVNYYISGDGQTIFKGDVYDVRKSPFQPAIDLLKVDDQPFLGTPGAPVTVVEFADFQCPYCKAEADIVALEAKVAELSAKADGPVSADKLPKEVAEELESLRQFRETHALEGDPVFDKKFAAPLQALDEAIYAKFTEIGVPPAAIEQMKGFGGPAALDLEDMYAKLEAAGKDTTSLKRFVEAKLVKREELADERTKAIAEAKTNYTKFRETRSQETTAAEKARLEEVQQHLSQMISLSPQFKLDDLPPNATAEQKKAHESSKNFLGIVQERMAAISKEMTPTNYAQAVAAMGMAYVFKAKLDAEVGVTKALQTELTETKARLETVLNAGRAPKPGVTTTPRSKGTPKPTDQFASTEDAFARYQEQQAAAQD